jgi:putative endonuclease
MLPRRNKQSLGQFGEDYATQLLRRKGYRLVTRNFRCKLGEIDIVAVKDDYLAFIEVKTRYSVKYGSPIESITPYKLNHIKKSAQYFSLIHPELPKKLKIEIIALELDDGKVSSEKIIKVE